MFDKILSVIKMKKLLLCILSLMLCLNTSIIHAKESESLMIVAHPDDETIWGGSPAVRHGSCSRSSGCRHPAQRGHLNLPASRSRPVRTPASFRTRAAP